MAGEPPSLCSSHTRQIKPSPVYKDSLVNEIDVFTLQDNFTTPVEPTEAMTFTQWGLTGYDVQYWNGSSWATVPGGSVSGNNKVWRKFTFAAVTTNKIA